MRPSLVQRLLAVLVIGVAALIGAGPAAAAFLNDAGVHTIDALGPPCDARSLKSSRHGIP